MCRIYGKFKIVGKAIMVAIMVFVFWPMFHE